MKLFQLLVVTAVLFANVHWQITPNGYLASIVAVMVAFGATCGVVGLIDLLGRAGRHRAVRARYKGVRGPPPLPQEARTPVPTSKDLRLAR